MGGKKGGKGGKNRRRGKGLNDEKRELIFKEDGQEYAQVGGWYLLWTIRPGSPEHRQSGSFICLETLISGIVPI